MGCVSSKILNKKCSSCQKEIVINNSGPNNDFYVNLDKEYFNKNNYCRRCSLLDEESKNFTYQ